MQTIFSPDRVYRYVLWRELPRRFDVEDRRPGPLMFICLNPSTADEYRNDPTVRRCISFARRWGFTSLMVTNLFGFRATDPVEMVAAADPVGPDNDRYLLECAKRAEIIVAAWGIAGIHLSRARHVRSMLANHGPLYCLGKTKIGEPKHPLYLSRKTTLIEL